MSLSFQALKPSVGMLKYLGIALGIYIFLAILSLIAHTLFGIEYWELEYTITNVWFEITGWSCQLRLPDFLGGGCLISVPRGVWHTETYTEVFRVDVITYLFVGAVLLIFFVLEKLLLAAVLIVIWIVNAFIIGKDPNTGALMPFSIFQIIGLIPFIGEWFRDFPAIPESAVSDLASGLATLRSFLELIITGGFAAGSETLIDFIERTVLGVDGS